MDQERESQPAVSASPAPAPAGAASRRRPRPLYAGGSTIAAALEVAYRWPIIGVVLLVVLVKIVPAAVDGVANGVHRRRLRERPRDLRRAARRRSGRARARRRQQPRAQGRARGAARHGAVPSPGRHRAGGRRRRASRLVVAQAQVRAARRGGAQHAVRSRARHRGRRQPARAPALQGRRVAIAEGVASTRAQADYDRGTRLITSGAVSREELDRRKEAQSMAQSRVEEARQGVYQIRVGLGLPSQPGDGGDLTQVPPDLDQTFSVGARSAGAPDQSRGQLGVASTSFDQTPRQMIAEFYKRDPEGNIDRIYAADPQGGSRREAGRGQACCRRERDLDQAKLDLRYCDVVAEIDGVVTRRKVNPGQQRGRRAEPDGGPLADRHLGRRQFQGDAARDAAHRTARRHRGRHVRQPRVFKGRVSGFTMGTGSTLALLPAENATGNFVKVVQRLPVRIELAGLRSGQGCRCFIGLSVTPRVRVHEPPTGPNAGKVLQPYPRPPRSPSRREPAMSADDGRRRRAQRASIRGGRRWPSSSRPSWRSSTRRSPTWRCATSPAGSRRRPATASGSSPAISRRMRSSCRSPAGSRCASAGATTSCSRSRSSRWRRPCAAWPGASWR